MKFSSKICIPLQPKTMSECRQLVKKAEKSSDIIEIWIDHISDLDLPTLMTFTKKPLLIVNKAKKEKGKWKDSEIKRVAALAEASRLGAKYIDIGIHTNPKLIKELNAAKKRSTKLVISFHDFTKTPTERKLNEVVTKMRQFKPDIIKIATHCKNHTDTLRLLTLLNHLRSKGQKAIILGMGSHGKFTRIYGCYLGNYLTFTPLTSKQALPAKSH